MVKNRIVYLIWLFAMGILHFFGNQFGTRVIFVASVVIPAVMILVAWLNSRRANVMPTQCQFLQENLFTGETAQKKEIAPEHCGAIRVTMLEPRITDIFGLVSFKVSSAPVETILVMPKLIDVEFEPKISPFTPMESDEYSQSHPGHDPTETFAIREYAPGDPLKSIHWKLSNKTDTLLVRELGLPVTQNILVLVETALEKPSNPELINTMGRKAYAICRSLLEKDTPHNIGWIDTETLEFRNHAISSILELDAR
ncbi:MAG: DUF58 domain-containing protein, partial [Defluviitaleaceae bacterium]|nr:DUF58 domain-containing protein [Defluviitaleaceae bacterium]